MHDDDRGIPGEPTSRSVAWLALRALEHSTGTELHGKT